MASYTTHGQYIPGTGEREPREVSPECSGRYSCTKCANEITKFRFEDPAFQRFYKEKEE